MKVKSEKIEKQNKLIKSFNSRYSENAHQAFKVLNINVLDVKYDVICKDHPKNVTKLSKMHAIQKKQNKSFIVSYGLWNNSPEVLWKLLELSKNKYMEYIKKYHPDRFPNANHKTFLENSKRAAIINRAWEVIEELFKRRGFEIQNG